MIFKHFLQEGPPDWLPGPPPWTPPQQPCWPPPCVPIGEYLPLALVVTAFIIILVANKRLRKPCAKQEKRAQNKLK